VTGSLSVLNVGAGDIQIVFDRHDSDERDKALRMLKDMQARGYAILVKLADGTHVRAQRIDPNLGRYIVELPGDVPAPADAEMLPPRKRGRPRRAAIPVTKAHATGVARSAGG
jgi:hypothetical protein